MSLTRLGAVVGANLKMLVRDRVALFFALLFPIIIMVLFGLLLGGVGSDKPSVNVVGSGPLVQALERSHALELHHRPDARVAIDRVRNGHEAATLVVTGAGARLYYAAASTIEAPIVLGVVNGAADQVNLAAAQARSVVTVRAQRVEAANLSYIDFLVPGLLAMALSQSAVFGVAFTLVAYRQRGILRRLRLTPLPIAEFAGARVISQLVLALVQTVLLLGIGWALFGVDLATEPGTMLALLPLVVCGALCFISIGFLIGSLVKTEDGAAAVSNVVTLPMTFLAGVFFPLTNAPAYLQALARLLPLTYLADGLRDVTVRHHSLVSVLPDIAVLIAITAVTSLISLRYFRWQVA